MLGILMVPCVWNSTVILQLVTLAGSPTASYLMRNTSHPTHIDSKSHEQLPQTFTNSNSLEYCTRQVDRIDYATLLQSERLPSNTCVGHRTCPTQFHHTILSLLDTVSRHDFIIHENCCGLAHKATQIPS